MPISFRRDIKNQIEQWTKFWQSKQTSSLYGKLNTWENFIWERGLIFFARLARLAPGKKVLECGCGKGGYSLYLNQHSYNTILVDNSWQALNLAKSYFHINGCKAYFVLCDVGKLAFKENAFDIVMSYGLLEHFRDIRTPIREMIRVLRPKGLFMSDIVTKKFSAQTLANIGRFSARFFKRIFTLRLNNIFKESLVRFPIYVNSFSKMTYKKIMSEEGLKDVTVTGTRPFPYLALPYILDKAYAEFMREMLWLWDWFDNSRSLFTDIWGLGWYSWGFKK